MKNRGFEVGRQVQPVAKDKSKDTAVIHKFDAQTSHSKFKKV